MNQHIQTEKDLEGLIGQYETMRLEFKSSRLLGSDKSKQQIIEDLAREVSAFANTEGGALVIGIETGRDAEKAMAVSLSEGVDPNLRKPEWLQQVVASNISPALNGMVVRPVPLSGPRKGKVAYVIEIPKGETAHQAPDLKYYGRHELESKPLADNEIRLRMNRGRAAHAVIELSSLARLSAEDEFLERQSELAQQLAAEKEEELIPPARRRALNEKKERLEAPRRVFDEYTLELGIKNDGPITIRDCGLSIIARVEADVTFVPEPEEGRWMFHFLPAAVLRRAVSQSGMTKEMVPVRERKLFPEQTILFPDAKLTMHSPVGTIPQSCSLQWTLYVEDAPSVTGIIDLTEAIRLLG